MKKEEVLEYYKYNLVENYEEYKNIMNDLNLLLDLQKESTEEPYKSIISEPFNYNEFSVMFLNQINETCDEMGVDDVTDEFKIEDIFLNVFNKLLVNKMIQNIKKYAKTITES